MPEVVALWAHQEVSHKGCGQNIVEDWEQRRGKKVKVEFGLVVLEGVHNWVVVLEHRIGAAL